MKRSADHGPVPPPAAAPADAPADASVAVAAAADKPGGPAPALRRDETLRGPALGALFAGALAISMAPILAKISISSGVGAVATAFWRIMLSIPVLLATERWQRRQAVRTTARPGQAAPHLTLHDGAAPGRRPITRTTAWMYLSLPGVLFALDLATWHRSFAYTPLANATLLANFATVWVAAVSWWWFGERFSLLFIAGSALALSGVAVILRVDFHINPDMLRGDGLALVTSLFYAAYILSIKRLRRGFTVLQIMLHSSIASAAALLPISLLMGESVLPGSPAAWWALIALALLSHCGGQGLITWALAHLPASLSSVSLLVQPVGAAVLAHWVFGEMLGSWQIAGGIVVLAGILLARLGSRM